MKYQFLCASHRQALAANTNQAMRCWRNSFEAGQTLADMGQCYEALPHLGCAFEASEIILTHDMLGCHDALILFTTSASTLATCLSQRGYNKQCEAVLQVTQLRLTREMERHTELSGIIQHQIHTLTLIQSSKQPPKANLSNSKAECLDWAQFERVEQSMIH